MRESTHAGRLFKSSKSAPLQRAHIAPNWPPIYISSVKVCSQISDRCIRIPKAFLRRHFKVRSLR